MAPAPHASTVPHAPHPFAARARPRPPDLVPVGRDVVLLLSVPAEHPCWRHILRPSGTVGPARRQEDARSALVSLQWVAGATAPMTSCPCSCRLAFRSLGVVSTSRRSFAAPLTRRARNLLHPLPPTQPWDTPIPSTPWALSGRKMPTTSSRAPPTAACAAGTSI